MRPLHIILFCLLALVVGIGAIVLAIKNAIDRLIFDYEFHDFQFDILDITSQLKNKNKAVLNTYFKLIVTNPTWLTLHIKDVDLKLYYNNVLFAELLKEGNRDFRLIKHQKTTFDRHISIVICRDTFPILGKYLKKETIPLTYEFKGKIYGINIYKIGSYDYES